MLFVVDFYTFVDLKYVVVFVLYTTIVYWSCYINCHFRAAVSRTVLILQNFMTLTVRVDQGETAGGG